MELIQLGQSYSCSLENTERKNLGRVHFISVLASASLYRVDMRSIPDVPEVHAGSRFRKHHAHPKYGSNMHLRNVGNS
jgi:hypothetical protein